MEQKEKDILTSLFDGSSDSADIYALRCSLGDRIFSQEDSLDELSPVWRYIRACFKTQFSASVPTEVGIYLILYALSMNEGLEKFARQDYLKFPGASEEFFSKYIEFLLWVFNDYQNSDPVQQENWLHCYQLLRTAWIDKAVPEFDQLRSICTITKKLTRNTKKRKTTAKERKAKRAKRTRDRLK